MKTQIKFRMLVATVAIMAMLAGSANAQERVNDFDVEYFNIEPGDDGDVINIYFETSTEYNYKKGDYEYLSIYNKELRQRMQSLLKHNESMMMFKLTEEGYKLFTENGFDYLEKPDGTRCYFNEDQRKRLTWYTIAKTTGDSDFGRDLNTGEAIYR